MSEIVIATIGDFHCGHKAGLTPPGYRLDYERANESLYQKKRKEFYNLEIQMWKEYKKIIKEIGKVDHLIVNGDNIDGQGEKSRGTELITSDCNEQADMAVRCIEEWDVKKDYYFTYGTDYHTGAFDHENQIASHFNGTIDDQLFLDIGGFVFDVKHHMTGGGGTAHPNMRNEKLHNMLWAESGSGQPTADIYIRSHLHQHFMIDTPEYKATVLPALQGAKSKYGGRRCRGLVHWGILWWIIDTKRRTIQWQRRIIRLQAEQATLHELS